MSGPTYNNDPWGSREESAAPAAQGFVASQDPSMQAPPARSDPSALLNFAATAAFFAFLWWTSGLWTAVALIFGLFVHEYGHVLAMNQLGCGPAKVRVIPLLGAVAIPARPAPTEYKGVLIAMAGPVIGLLAAAPFFIAYAITGEEHWFRPVTVIAALSLFNLAPVPPLDGSHVLGPLLARVHPMLERAVLILLGIVGVGWSLKTGHWMIGGLLVMTLISTLTRGVERPFALRLTNAELAKSAGAWLAAAVLSLGLMWLALDGLGLRPGLAALFQVFGL